MKTSLLLLLLAAACAPSGDSADTGAAVPAVDTLKAAPGTPADSIAARDSAGAPGATGVSQTPAGTPTTSRITGTKTATKTTPADTTNIGRDRAIQFDPKKPRLPVVDTTKRPPE